MLDVQRMVRARRVLLVPSIVGLVLMAAAVGGGVLGTTAVFGTFSTAAMLTCALLLLPTLATIGALSRAWMIGMFAAALRGGEPLLGASLRQTIHKWRPLAAIATVQVTLRTLADQWDRYDHRRLDPANRTTRGMLANVMAIAAEVAAYLLAPVLVVEQQHLAGAINRMHELHRGSYQSINLGDRGLRLVPVLVTCVIGGASLALYLVLTRLAPEVAPWVARGGLAAAIAFYATTASQCRAAYHTCLYLWAVERDRYGSGAPPPELLGRVLQPRQSAAAG